MPHSFETSRSPDPGAAESSPAEASDPMAGKKGANGPDDSAAVGHRPTILPRQRVAIIYNPTAGSRGQGMLTRVRDWLEGQGCRVDVLATRERGDGMRLGEALARAEEADQPDAVVAAGGDGTINEVMNGLENGRLARGTALPLPMAILPMGTANVLAAEIGLHVSPEAIGRTILTGYARRVSAGVIKGLKGQGGPVEHDGARRFIMMAGIGLDAHVVEHVSLVLKRPLGKMAYALQALREIQRLPCPRYRVQVETLDENSPQEFETAAAILANGRYYGGANICARDANLESEDLQLCLFQRFGPHWSFLYGCSLPLGILPRMAGFSTRPVRRIVITAPDGDPVQADGDFVARLPVAISLETAGPLLVCPPGRR